MKKIFILISFVQFQFTYSQIIVNDFPLSKIIEETSGLEIIGDYLITHNDSDGYPILYYLSKDGEITFAWSSDDPKQLPDFSAIQKAL